MSLPRKIHVHLSPLLLSPGVLRGGVTIVADVLRATTTIVHAISAGCSVIYPVAEVDEARRLAKRITEKTVLLAGERDGQQLPGFDLGNSPAEFTGQRVAGKTLVLTTTNGTRALLAAQSAERIWIGAFVNLSAVCTVLRDEARPIHVLCAGESGDVSLEDTLFAGAVANFCCQHGSVRLDDGARLARDFFDLHSADIAGLLSAGSGGARLLELGYHDDIRAAANVDAFAVVPELLPDPTRVVIGASGA